MLEHILYASTEIALLCGIVLIIFDTFFSVSSQKKGLKIAGISVLFGVCLNILFYNKSFYPPLFEASAYISFISVVMYLMAYVVLKLCTKWYILQNQSSSNSFAVLVLMLLICYTLFIKMTSWAGLLSLSFLILFLQYLMLRLNSNEDVFHFSRRYGFVAVLLAILMGVTLIYTLYYTAFSDIILLTDKTEKTLIALSVLVIFSFLLGVAPFHFATIDCISRSDLQIATYFHLVPFMGIAGTFLKFQPFLSELCGSSLADIYLLFGFISVVFGVIGAYSTHFFKRVLAFSNLYILGVWLIFMSFTKMEDMSFCLIYLIGYFVTILGIDTCLYHFKSGSQDVDHFDTLSGIYYSKPYLTSAFILFILCLSGLPPFVGFITELSILKTVVLSPFCIIFVLSSLFLLLPIYLKIIYIVSFLPKERTFDRISFGTYVWLLLYVGFILFLMIYPSVFLELLRFA